VFHYAHNAERDVGFALYEDASRYDAFDVNLDLPTLVFQGSRDALVDPDQVRGWAASRPAVDLRMLDDEHQLTASIEDIWRASAAFFGLRS
jgi:predicted alpha/beta-hydrolase family hydrolase